MYSNIQRDSKFINELKSFITNNYNLNIELMEETPRGFYGETWTIVTGEKKFFVKMISAEVQSKKYMQSFEVMQYLIDSGIDFIPSIVRDNRGELYTKFHNSILGVFDFVEGENRDDYDLMELLTRLIRVYQLSSTSGLVQFDNFDGEVIKIYEGNIERLTQETIKVYKDAHAVILKNQEFLDSCKGNLKWLISHLNGSDIKKFITHGDTGGNVIVGDENLWIIDWDDPKLAAIERDIWLFAPYVDIKDFMNKLLLENDIDYTVSDKLIAYYTYWSLFYYLVESFRALFELESIEDKEAMVRYIEGTINGWIRKQVSYADGVATTLIEKS